MSETSMNDKQIVIDFLSWMNKNKIDACIKFFAIQEGRDPKVPVWTDGKKLYNANELYKKYSTTKLKA